MFCFQCQETAKNTGCTIQGICGKDAETSDLQDLLIYALEGIAFWAHFAKEVDIEVKEEDMLFVAEGLFSTITNVNFDAERVKDLIEKAMSIRDSLKEKVLTKEQIANVPDAAKFNVERETFLGKAKEASFLREEDEDIRSLKSLILFGLKGIAAYLDHAYILKFRQEAISDFIVEALYQILRSDITVEELVKLALACGQQAVEVMSLLDKANTSTYGDPEPTQVFRGRRRGPGILVSGHDLLDLEEILKQAEGKGINVYTHGEMLPAHAYPKLKQYKHLTGNYGGSWYLQQKEFAAFGGAIVMTTNCIQKPLDSYRDRIFTTGLVRFPQVEHIAERGEGMKDFSPLINKALEIGELPEEEGEFITVGFARHTLLSSADKVIELVKREKVRKFVVMAGCDGRHKAREYYTEFAKKLPKDVIVLTAGCAKYRYNHLDLGSIDGLPRLLDAGQCNDSYSLVALALKLKEVLGLDDINDLPIAYNISWYEQKAVGVLLALLYLGIKNIHLGPTLPAFISPQVLALLADKFRIKAISTVDEDIKSLVG